MIWTGLLGGSIEGLAKPGFSRSFLDSVRASLPLVAGYLALMLVLIKFPRHRAQRFLLFSPLGFTTVYGLVGVGSSLVAPDGSVAIFWVASYISVPLVVWAITWDDDALDRIRRLINFNWLILLLGVTALFVIALLYLDLGSRIIDPSSLLTCDNKGQWLGLGRKVPGFESPGLGGIAGPIRDTGVGRYAALAALIALSGLWHQKWRALWVLIFAASIVLLLDSGARLAIVAFPLAATLIIYLYGGKKALLAGLVAIALLAPIAWGTGVHRTFLQGCLAGNYNPAFAQSVFLLPTVPTGPSQQNQDSSSTQLTAEPGVEPPVSSAQLAQNQSELGTLTLLSVPPGKWILERPSSQGTGDSPPALRLEIPPGEWVLEQVSPEEQFTPQQPGFRPIPPGNWVLRSASATQRGASDSPVWDHVPAEGGVLTLLPFETSIPGQQSPPKSGQEQLSGQNTSPPAITVQEQLSGQSPAASAANIESGIQASFQVTEGLWILKRVSENGSAVSAPSALAVVEHPSGKASLLSGSVLGWVPEGFFTFTGRTVVWAEGWKLFEKSPLLGYGFHADRVLLGTHMHNSFMHALIQTGLVGTVPFLAALIYGWVLLFQAIRKLSDLATVHKHLVIQTAGVLAFLSLRATMESTGAFYGVDWFFLAPLLLYLKVVNRSQEKEIIPA